MITLGVIMLRWITPSRTESHGQIIGDQVFQMP
jgi:hypothetical protein